MVARNPVPAAPQRFPFGLDFQKMLLRLLAEDAGFAFQCGQYLRPEYFENEALAWAWSYMLRYRERYQTFPSLAVVREEAGRLDPRYATIYRAVVEQAGVEPIRDEVWIRDNVLDFIRRNIFVRAFHESREQYNAGQTAEAYDTMMQRMQELLRAAWEPVARTWLCQDLAARQTRRLRDAEAGDTITSGFPSLDHLMGGGPRYGELLIWIAYAKIGKSIALINHGVAAVRDAYKNVLHCVFEGSPKLVEDRYDASFSGETYRSVRSGQLDARRYAQLYQEYQQFRQKIVVRTFVDRWDYSVVDIQDELVALKRDHGWKPDCIVVDYGDLLEGRGGKQHHRNTYESQKAAFRDLKSLANRGYVLWTASQATRPDENAEHEPHELKARDIADCYEKVRIADFIGSINQTLTEKQEGRLRLYLDTYRDAAMGGKVVRVWDNRDTMVMREGEPPAKPPPGAAPMPPVPTQVLGYAAAPRA